MLDTLRPMAVFAKTVEAGSFRAAATALRLSPSVVSHHIAQLEARLGVALLYRSTRRLSLTREGEQLFQAARKMSAAAESGIDALSNLIRQPAGELRITAPAVLGNASLVEDLAAFAREYPRIRLSLSFSDVRQDMISGGFDVAIRMGWMKSSNLKSKKLFEVRRILVAAPSYVSARPRARKPSDLANWEWLHLTPLVHAATFRRKSATPTKIDFTPRITVDDAVALYRLSKTGLGLAMVPEFLASNDLATGNMKLVLPGWDIETLNVYAVWPPNAPRTSLTMRLVSFLEARVRMQSTLANAATEIG